MKGVGGTCHNDKPGLLMMLMMMMMMMMVRMMMMMMMMVMTRMMKMMMMMIMMMMMMMLMMMMMMRMMMMMMMMMVMMMIMMRMLMMRMPDPIKGWSEIPPHQRGGHIGVRRHIIGGGSVRICEGVICERGRGRERKAGPATMTSRALGGAREGEVLGDRVNNRVVIAERKCECL